MFIIIRHAVGPNGTRYENVAVNPRYISSVRMLDGKFSIWLTGRDVDQDPNFSIEDKHLPTEFVGIREKMGSGINDSPPEAMDEESRLVQAVLVADYASRKSEGCCGLYRKPFELWDCDKKNSGW